MSCLTTAQLIAVREEIGSADASGWPDERVLDLADDLGVSGTTAPQQVALSIVKQQIADLLNAPSQWSLSGDYNENWSNNITRLTEQVERLRAEIAAGDSDLDVVGLGPVVTTSSLGQLVPDDQFRIGDLD